MGASPDAGRWGAPEPDDPWPRAITIAARGGHTEVAHALLDAGAVPQAGSRMRSDTLVASLWCDDPELFRRLLALGLDPNWEGMYGATLMHICAASGATGILPLLVELGLSIDQADREGDTPLHYAAFNDRSAMARALLAAGAPVDPVNQDDFTPLTVADMLGGAETIDVLIEAGADPDARERHRLTPLHRAVIGGRVAGVRAALAGGADVDARDYRRCTPLHHAARRDRPAIVRALIEAGADLDALDVGGDIPLILAAGDQRGRHPATVAALLDAGARLDVSGWEDTTALHALVYKDDVPHVRRAIALGAPLEARDINGATPLLLAATYAHLRCIEVLAAAGADVRARNHHDETAIHEVLGGGVETGLWTTRVARRLVALGADPGARDDEARTAADRAEALGLHALAAALGAQSS